MLVYVSRYNVNRAQNYNASLKLRKTLVMYVTVNALSISRIDAVLVVKDDIVIYRKNDTILTLNSSKRYFSHPEKSILNLSLP